MKKESIKSYLNKSIEVKKYVINENIDVIWAACTLVKETLAGGNILYIIGNGGSAADAQHFAAEFVSRFLKERQALPAIALTTNTSVITAIGNDYSFDRIFARQIEAFVKENDLVIAISTSGNSTNLIEGLKTAKAKKAKTLALLGNGGGKMSGLADVSIIVNSNETPHVQEAQLAIEHLIVKLVEEDLAC